jgi:hypothetical protein
LKPRTAVAAPPFHFALSHAGRKIVPVAVHLLLGIHKNIINIDDNGPLPLRVLSDYTAKMLALAMPHIGGPTFGVGD